MLTAGVLLKTERKKQSITLDKASAATKINRSYLEALEHDDYHRFPSSVYAKGFLRNYAKYLGADSDKVLALYRRSVGKREPFLQDQAKKVHPPTVVLTPAVVVIAVITTVVLAIVGYLIFQFYNFQKPPALTVESPQQNAIVHNRDVTISGSTDPGMLLTINDESIRLGNDGSFSESLALNEGSNSFVVKSRHPDNVGKEAVITLTIEYVPREEFDTESSDTDDPAVQGVDDTPTDPNQASDPGTPASEMTIEVTVGAQNSWIEIQIDGEQLYSSIAPAGTVLTYSGKQTLYLLTGKPTATTVAVNGLRQSLYIQQGGIGTITCDFDNSTVSCHQPE